MWRTAMVVAGVLLTTMAPLPDALAGGPQHDGAHGPLDPDCGPRGASRHDAPSTGDRVASTEQVSGCRGLIQPGARMTNGCTMAFVLADAKGELYFATAGHCAEEPGETLGVEAVGDAVAVVVFNRFWDGGPDVAVARVFPEFRAFVDPTMCYWGGPVGLGMPADGDLTYHYGWGGNYSRYEATRARVGLLLGWNTSELSYLGLAQGGDSGAPVMDHHGKALAIHVRSGLVVEGQRVDPSWKFATRLDAALALVNGSTNLGLRVVPGSTPPCGLLDPEAIVGTDHLRFEYDGCLRLVGGP